MAAPEVDEVEGLSPAVALQQQRGSPPTRSSVRHDALGPAADAVLPGWRLSARPAAALWGIFLAQYTGRGLPPAVIALIGSRMLASGPWCPTTNLRSASGRSPLGQQPGRGRTSEIFWSRWATTWTGLGANCRRRTAIGSCVLRNWPCRRSRRSCCWPSRVFLDAAGDDLERPIQQRTL